MDLPLENEPLLSSTNDRYTVFPIRYPVLWQMYRKARESYWLPDEIDLSVDVCQWNATLTDTERHSLSHILAFFATADGIVAENLVERFASEVTIPEARSFYGFQIAMEGIHAETYSMLLEAFIEDEHERRSLLSGSAAIPTVSAKNSWTLKWVANKRSSFAERLVAFACVEGIYFSSSFAFIFKLKSLNKMPGLSQSNDLISRDEGLHTEFACVLLRTLRNRPPFETVRAIVQEAVEIEMDFARETLDRPVLGLTVESMCRYIKFIADQLLRAMGYAPVYEVVNPYRFMAMASLSTRTNYFEHRNSDYRLPTGGGRASIADRE